MTSYVKRVGDLTDEDGFVDCTYATEASTDSAFDPVTKPSHYAFKYIWRWRDKNGIEDLKKARECIDNMIRAIEGDGDE